MNKKALVILAKGFEETEAIVSIDILRRSEIEVIVAGSEHDVVIGAHGIAVKTDIKLEDYDGLPDAIVLPGGMPGAENLAKAVKIKDILLKMKKEKKLIAAICASPALVLAPAGILDEKSATCYPGLEKNFSSKTKISEEKIVQDGNVITSRGAGTAHLFGFKIAENLVGKEKADMIAEQMLYSR